LKHCCLANNKILKIGTDGSVNLRKEMASFGWLLIGNKNVLVRGSGPVDGVTDVALRGRNCSELVLQMSFSSIL
jgi:hypothetical protein